MLSKVTRSSAWRSRNSSNTRAFSIADRLVGESAHELDLPFRERLHPLAGKPDHPDWLALG
jgi:hypothetical protein